MVYVLYDVLAVLANMQVSFMEWEMEIKGLREGTARNGK